MKAAYAVKSPDDNRELYAKWAATYEQFLETNRYVYARQVAEIFAERSSAGGEPVLTGSPTQATCRTRSRAGST